MTTRDFPTGSLCAGCQMWNGDPAEMCWPDTMGFCTIKGDMVEAQGSCPEWRVGGRFTKEEIEGVRE